MITTQKTQPSMAATTAYTLFSFPVLTAIFVAVVSLVAIGGATVLLGVGLPVLMGGLLLARTSAEAQRELNASLTGMPAVSTSGYYSTSNTQGWRRMLAPVLDSRSWLDVLWVAVSFGVSILTWSAGFITFVVASLVVFGPLMIFGAAYFWPGLRLDGSMAHQLGLPFPNVMDALFCVAIGIVAIIVLPRVMRMLTNVQLRIADVLLIEPVRAQQEIEELTQSRRSANAAETESLRRLERDIHDGPQQGLVRLQMDLARAKRVMEKDPERAMQILEDSVALTGVTLADLRNLSKGIAPPVLVDRGLEAAVDQLAATSSVRVDTFVNVPRNVPTHAEVAAYFFIAEALTNVNKHAEATRATITMGISEEQLLISVVDDGRGGASAAKGSGLRGLHERLEGIGGSVSVTSPQGGPTTLEAVIPCAL